MIGALIIVAYYTMNMNFALSQMPPVSTTLKKIMKKMTLSDEVMLEINESKHTVWI